MLLLSFLHIFRRDELDQRSFSDLKTQYESLYRARLSGSAWTALNASDPCDRGTHAKVDREDTIRRIQYYRWLVGVPWNVSLDESYNAVQAAAAAYMQANGELNHRPSSDGKCYSEEAHDGASHSNLAAGAGITSSFSITMYMDDSNTPSLGHRRWVINWGTAAFGLWQTADYGALRTFSVPMYNTPVNVSFVAYPPGGPSVLSDAKSYWHFQRPGMNQLPTVTITRADGVQLPVTVTLNTEGYGSMPAAVIEISDKKNIVKGFQYQVKLVLGNDIFEWYPYFVDVSSNQWSGQDPVLFKEQILTPPEQSSAGKSTAIAVGATIGAIAVVAVIVVTVLLVRKRISLGSNEKTISQTGIPILNP
jgi:hypothetical protein